MNFIRNKVRNRIIGRNTSLPMMRVCLVTISFSMIGMIFGLFLFTPYLLFVSLAAIIVSALGYERLWSKMTKNMIAGKDRIFIKKMLRESNW